MPSLINRKTSPRRAWSARASSASVNSTRAVTHIYTLKWLPFIRAQIPSEKVFKLLEGLLNTCLRRPYRIPVAAETEPSATKPRRVGTQPAGLEASTAGRPSNGCGLQTRTAFQSAMAAPGADLQEHHTHRWFFTRGSGKAEANSSLMHGCIYLLYAASYYRFKGLKVQIKHVFNMLSPSLSSVPCSMKLTSKQ